MQQNRLLHASSTSDHAANPQGQPSHRCTHQQQSHSFIIACSHSASAFSIVSALSTLACNRHDFCMHQALSNHAASPQWQLSHRCTHQQQSLAPSLLPASSVQLFAAHQRLCHGLCHAVITTGWHPFCFL